MTIIPEDKNWTWVLERSCPECGFDAGAFDPSTIADALDDNAAAWVTLLDHEQVRVRPEPHTWSALEYGCHVRDVFVLFNERLRMMLEHDDPTYQNWDQDATAISERYDEQDPADVKAALLHATASLAARFQAVEGDQWQRTGTRSDGARFTVSSFAQYLIHDSVHHLYDVEHGYRLLADL